LVFLFFENSVYGGRKREDGVWRECGVEEIRIGMMNSVIQEEAWM